MFYRYTLSCVPLWYFNHQTRSYSNYNEPEQTSLTYCFCVFYFYAYSFKGTHKYRHCNASCSRFEYIHNVMNRPWTYHPNNRLCLRSAIASVSLRGIKRFTMTRPCDKLTSDKNASCLYRVFCTNYSQLLNKSVA